MLGSQPHNLSDSLIEARMDRFKNATLCGFLLFSLLTLGGCEELIPRDMESIFFPRFYRSEFVGFLAGIGTTFAALPDLVAMLRRRSSSGMNPRMAAITGAFQILWIYYGLLIASRPVILWNLIAVLINFLSVFVYHYFQKREIERYKVTLARASGDVEDATTRLPR
jgi:uncharacterized protein with PQ loop repeat